jgi:cobalt-zinc-cadmium efflux system protein
MVHRGHDRQALCRALALTGVFLIVEVLGGWWTNSLALLSDAAHMFTDLAALSLGLFALWVGGRSPSESKTYGYYRAEILAALVNGLALWLVVLWIAYEAYERLHVAPVVRRAPMTGVAVLGLLTNSACAWLLAPRRGASLNLRAAFVHVLADLLGSVGVVAAGVVMLATGWTGADAVAALCIAVLILLASWGLIREAVDILMEAVPRHIDLEALRADLESVPGTEHVHDLHVWALTTGQYALSAHAVVDGSVDGERVIDEMRQRLLQRFHIDHVTIQLERSRPCAPESVHL